MENMLLTIEHEQKSRYDEQTGLKSKYGFCLMCHKPADYYCKDTKIPVCGSDCKKAHLNYISNNPCLDYQYPLSLRQ